MEHSYNAITSGVAQDQRNGLNGAEGEEQELVDFKMVTFSLGGKDYAIDIMKVKEIAKFTHFTFVPNTMPFVRGVYNLRGEIISIIDLRSMFNLAAQEKAEGQPEDGLILRLEDNTLGVVVDNIDRVVGISSSTIQPPHPIFADINLSYISGVVEFEGRLYIILDVDRIFSKDGTSDKSGLETAATSVARDLPETPASEPVEALQSPAAGETSTDVSFEFVAEGLATLKALYVSDVNRDWVRRRFDEWKQERSARGADVQLQTEEDARAFVRPFYSGNTGDFWDASRADELQALLPEISGNLVHAWNPGCGKGFETYCLAVVLRRRYPNKQIKIWAGDNDLLSISTAPNLVFPYEQVPEYCRDYVVQGTNGYSFSSEIKDSIFFEYSDIANPNSVPQVSIIVSRDVLSFLPEVDQHRVIAEMKEKLTPEGVIVLGDHEDLSWDPELERKTGGLSAFGKS